MTKCTVVVVGVVLFCCAGCPTGDTSGDDDDDGTATVPCLELCVQSGLCVDNGAGCYSDSGISSCNSWEQPGGWGVCSELANPQAALCCVSGSDDDCYFSTACKTHGKCAMSPSGRCHPATIIDCAQSDVCLNEGACNICPCGPWDQEQCCC